MTETEKKLFSKIGEQHLEIERLTSSYKSLIETLASIVRGDIDLSRVMVNLTDYAVVWAPIGERPGLPATINGLPICVVAPEKQPETQPN